MDRRGWFGRLISASSQLLWPKLCEVCGRQLNSKEEVLCLHCELGMPLTHLHECPDFNMIHERLASHPPIERAASLFYYIHNDPYRNLILHAKYNGRPSVMRVLGRRYGLTLLRSGFMDGIDLIESVPMHWLKELRRGFNQTDWLAEGISDATGIEIGGHLRVSRRHDSQTNKSQTERWSNAANSYTVTDGSELTGKHILLVDDVITTGATVSTCARLLHASATGIRISVASLGLTQLH